MASIRTALALVFASVIAVSAAGPDLRLIGAVKAGDRPTALALLRQRVDANVKEADGTTAMHWAVRSDDSELVSALLRGRAAADPANRYGVTPLFLAATNGNLAIAEMLVGAGANPNAAMLGGQTVLMAAARAGHAAVVEALLARGADANARESRLGETALMWAAAENHADAISALVRHGAAVNARSTKADFPRFSFGDGIVALMMTLPRGDWTSMMYASRQGAVDAVRALAQANADLNLVDPEGTTALMLAINNAHYGAAAELIEQGADLNVADVTGMSALYAAVNMNTLGNLPGRPAPKPTGKLTAIDIARMLLARGANPNARLLRPILMRHHSAGDGALGEGATPLLRAAKTGDVQMMRLLLDAGGDASLTTRNQTTAVMLAAGPASGGLGGNYPVPDANKILAIDLGLEGRVDINAVDANGQTALHVAAGQGGPVIVAALVQRGSKLDLKDTQGRTPLDVALGAGGRGGQPVVRKENVEVLRRAIASEAAPPTAEHVAPPR